MAIVNFLNARFTPRGEGESSLAAVLSNSMAAPLQTLPDRPLREATLAMDFAENGSQGETRGVAHTALIEYDSRRLVELEPAAVDNLLVDSDLLDIPGLTPASRRP